MLKTLRLITHILAHLFAIPGRIIRFFLYAIMFNPRLGPARYIVAASFAYVLFAGTLVYVVAPIRGYTGQLWLGEKLQYDSERWLATAIYDAKSAFVGTFDPRLDSKRDVNYTGVPIEIAGSGYVANPDHKSIPVRVVPEQFWRCLKYHEDRNLGTILNPFGIDFAGVLKIPYSSVKRSIKARSIRFGVGGSTLPMQLARVIYKTPPMRGESAFEKIARKLKEWWLAPVIYRELTKSGSNEPLKRWAANHLWLAQRTGGPPLHGVEMTSRIVFGKPAEQLTIAEQFVLASAVNKPIILLEGSERLNAVRLDRWQYIVEVRARACAAALVKDETAKTAIWFELTRIANGPPDPILRPRLQKALEFISPSHARRARANPALRANLLIPAVRYGVREEMKNEFGFGWREYVRGARLTIDVAANRRFRNRVRDALAKLQTKYASRIKPDYTLDASLISPLDADGARRLPDVVIVAANHRGEIVRYFEATNNASYYGSPLARNAETGRYERERETRAIASIGKMLAAIGIANHGSDTLNSKYVDRQAPPIGLESCRRNGTLRRLRRAEVAFACSLNTAVEWRAARLGQARMRRLISAFGFNMPPAPNPIHATPPSTAAVRGFITGSPRRVHHMAAVILASLTKRGHLAIPQPTLVRHYDESGLASEGTDVRLATTDIVPNRIIRPGARKLLRQLLSAPLCYQHGKRRHGTLKSISDWCAKRRADVRLHFAKTGTQVTIDPNETVDTWLAGGIQFRNGKSYSYVIVVGTGNGRKAWASRLHSSQIAAPLARVLLQELKRASKERAVLVRAEKRTAKVR